MKISTTLLAILLLPGSLLGNTIVTDWTSIENRSAVGILNGVVVTAATSSDSEFLTIDDTRFTSAVWQTELPMEGADMIMASDVNAGDTHTFVFVEPFENLLFYIESFDSGSDAVVTVGGAGTVQLLHGSPSISLSPISPSVVSLSSANPGFDGEGDAILSVTGSIESLSMDFVAGDGANEVFYTLALNVPESVPPMTVLGLAPVLVATVRKRRR